MSTQPDSSQSWSISMAGAIAVLMFNALPAFLGAAAFSYKFDNAQLGNLAAAYFAGHTLMTVLAGLLMRRIPAGPGARVAALLAAGAFLLMIWFDSYEQLLPLLGLAGLGGGTLFVIVIASLSAGPRATRDIGRCYLLQMLLAALVVFASPIVIVPNWGAQGLLVVYGLGFLAAATLSNKFPSANPAPNETAPAPVALRRRWAFKATPVFILLAILVHYIGFAAIWGFLELMGTRAGFSASFVGLVLMGSLLGGAIGALFTIRLENRFGLRKPLLVANLGLIAAVTLLLTGGQLPVFYAVAVIAINTFDVFVVNCMFAGVAARDCSGDHAPLAPAAQGTGAMIGPAIAGAISLNGFAPALLMGVAGIALAMAALYWSPVLKGIRHSPFPE